MLARFKIQNSKFKIQNCGSFLKKTFYILITVFTFYFLLFTLPTSTLAQTLRLADARSGPMAPATPASTLPTTNYQLPTTISPTSPLYTDLLVNNLFHSFSCLAIGQSLIGQPCLTYKVTQNAQGALQGVPVLSQVNTSGGILGSTTNLIGMLYQNPPVRTADYLASVGQGFGVIKTANAQVGGSGAAVLNPILTLWQVSRNMSYIVMIIIFLVIGLMVMFRNKLNPQTVITAQAALPGLVIGLIMITFSYFLAGLTSDMAFIGTNVVGYYFQAAQGITTPDNLVQKTLVQKTQDQNVLSLFSRFVGTLRREDAEQAVDAIFNSFSGEVQTLLRVFVGIISYQFASQIGGILPAHLSLLGPVVGLVGALGVQTAISPILGFIIAFISVAALIYTMLKLLLRLVNTYITILWLTITAPFQFLLAALPGRQKIITDWVLNMLANILAFPAVIAVFYFVNYLLGSAAINNSVFQVNSQPSITGTFSFPLFGGMDISFLRIIIAFGALLATPTIPDIILKTFGQNNQVGQMLGQEISGGIRSGRGYTNQAGGLFRTAAQQYQGLRDEPGWAYGQLKNQPTGTEGWYRTNAAMSGAKPGSLTKLRERFGF